MIESNSSVVAASPVDDDKVLCIIRDFVDSHGGTAGKQTLNLPASISAQQAATDIARCCGYREGTVSVHYEITQGGNADILLEEQELGVTLGMVCDHGAKRYHFNIHEIEGSLPQKLTDTSDSSTTTVNAATNLYHLPIKLGATTEDSPPTYSSTLSKSDTGYLGLVNQAMTCYLNSLLQTLYMTPEFRNALYRWSFDGTEEESVKSIPYHLQRIFLQLQTSKKRSVETTDLTRSFGWDSSEVWQQHDVQELCRVMFDALEQKWKNTVQANLINQLYQGKMKDYVKCLQCGYESARMDTYLDIPLVIRPFGSTETYDSVEKAMNAFVQPETLEGSNQYFCEKCNKKCNAHKGLKFLSFPYLLTLQLKRFDFDYATMHRIKLNDRMTFPERLDLNSFVSPAMREEAEEDDRGQSKADQSDITLNGQADSSDEGIDEGIDVETGCSVASFSSDSSSASLEHSTTTSPATASTTNTASNNSSANSAVIVEAEEPSPEKAGGDNPEAAAINNSKNAHYSTCKGPFEYELFSIMIHSGSAAGGHYYAYIKSFRDGQWYSFNDQQVSKITIEDIRKTYGGSSLGRGFYTSAYTSSTSAYMLMYRQIDKLRNADFMQPEDFPESLKAELQQQKAKEEAERRQREIDKSTCKIKLYCFHPVDQRKLDVRLEIHKDKTLTEATQLAWERLDLQGTVPLECCRLVKYDEYQDSLERSYEGEEDTPISAVLGGVKANYTFDLLLETRRPDQAFLVYKPGGVTVKVHVVNIHRGVIQAPISVRAYHVQTVQEFKVMLAQTLGVEVSNMRCVLERFHNELKPLIERQNTLKAEGFFKSHKVFVECSGDPKELSVPYKHSALFKLLDQYQNTIRITCQLPSQKAVESYVTTASRKASKESILYKTSTSTITATTASIGEEGVVGGGGRKEDTCHVEEGISENDSACYSRGTNSKHSLSAVDPDSNFSISSSITADPNFAVQQACPTTTPLDDRGFYKRGIVEPSVCEEPSSSGGSGVGPRKHSLTHSQEQLTLDMSSLYLGKASHSDPSIYHSCGGPSPVGACGGASGCIGGGCGAGGGGEASDSSMQCGLGSDTSTSAELSCPDPDPVLSSPELAYEEEEEDEGVEIEAASGRGMILELVSTFSIQKKEEEDDDWDTALNQKPLQSFPSSSSLAQDGSSAPVTYFTASGPPPSIPPPPLPPPPPPSYATATRPLCQAEEEVEDNVEVKRYFRATVISHSSEEEDRNLDVSVDKRITLGAFKRELEPLVGVASNFFKVYRVYSNNQEFESVKLSDTLTFFEDGKLNIKLGRALQAGEHRVKVFQLCINEPEPCKYLLETIFAQGMTVLESKLRILAELKDQLDTDIPLDRCRLRKKSWSNPATVYPDSHVYEKDIPIYPNWEIFLEVLQGPEEMQEPSELAIYVRQWRPSTHQVGPLKELVLQQHTVEQLRSKISAYSGIPAENVDFAKGKGTFPYEVSILEMDQLDWNPNVSSLNMWPLYICDDGHVLYFRDSTEEGTQLSEERRKEIQQKENRISRQSQRISCSPRKERALKIYTDDDHLHTDQQASKSKGKHSDVDLHL